MLRKPLLTVHDAAAQLQVKESTIRTWIRQDKLRAIKFGREWRIAVIDLENFLNQNANFGEYDDPGSAFGRAAE
jgi:excisionase family DNA binding protein